MEQHQPFGLTLYCNSFHGRKPLHTQYNQKTIMGGSHFLNEVTRKKCLDLNYILDDTQENISHLNYLLGDLTGLYWVWKNTDDEFVGTNQYRRFYNEEELNNFFPLDTNTLFVSEFIPVDESIWQQFARHHGELGIKILMEAARIKKISITPEMIQSLNQFKFISPCNMFFAQRKIFDSVCSVLFDIIFELYEGTKYTLPYIQDNIHSIRSLEEKRLLAFLAERVLNILYIHSNHFFGKVKIQPVKYRTIL